jgi:hypothetical protein
MVYSTSFTITFSVISSYNHAGRTCVDTERAGGKYSEVRSEAPRIM